MKKFLFGILTFLGIGLSFCSADIFSFPLSVSFEDGGICDFAGWKNITDYDLNGCYAFSPDITNYVLSYTITFLDSDGNVLSSSQFSSNYFCVPDGTISISYSNPSCVDDSSYNWQSFSFGYVVYDDSGSGGGGEDTGSVSTIDVYYNNGNSTETITCDGTQAIQINGLSTITSTNTFTPYYNISYTDEDNQKLTESYSKDILYLENGQFKKTYTGNNDWILSVQGENSEISFSGYLPIFEITGGIEEVSESGNIFNNFAENSLKFTLSNIPSYIQYVILLFILFFILGFIRKFRRK